MFSDILKVPNPNITQHRKVPNSKRRSTYRNNSCKDDRFNPNRPFSYNRGITLPTITPQTPAPFLRKAIDNEKAAVESLLKVAAKIGPVVNKIVEKEKAYDAAFESEVPAPIPTYGSSLQGFALLMFFVSYGALMIVVAIYINATTGNAAMAGGTFVGLLIGAFISMGLIKRYG